MKICGRCDGDGPFNQNRSAKDGLSPYCTFCMRQFDRESYQRHREERNEKKRAWRKENPEKVKETKRAWEKENPEKLKAMYKRQGERRNASARARYARDPSKKAASHRRWRQAHPERELAVRMRRRARKREARGEVTGEQLAARLEVFGGMCAYCANAPYEDFDHAIALAKGGTNWPANIRPACKKCNDRKGTNTWRLVNFGQVVEGIEVLSDLMKALRNRERVGQFSYAERELHRQQYREAMGLD